MTTTEPATRLTADEAAAVLLKHESMCWWVARRTGKGLTEEDLEDLEDLAGVVRVQFVRATQTFDPSRGLQFGTYALRAAIAQARQAARRLRARGVRVPVTFDVAAPALVDLNASLDEDAPDVLNAIALAPEEPADRIPADVWERAGRVLTPMQRRCLVLRYREDLTLREIAERVQRSKERVRQTLTAAVSKLRDAGTFAEYAQ